MLLQPMLARLAAASDLGEVLRVGLQDVIALHGIEMGSVRLLDDEGQLVVVQARGLPAALVRTFGRVPIDQRTICGRAARLRGPLFVEDVVEDAGFQGFRELAASVPFRSVLCCPLITRSGELVGVVSAHSSHAFAPTALELSSLEAYASRLADAIAARLQADDRARDAERLARLLRADAA